MMRTAFRVLCLTLAGLACSPGPAARAGPQGTFRAGADLARGGTMSGPYQIGDIKIRGCYGLIIIPRMSSSVAAWAPNVMVLLDPPDRVRGVRCVGFAGLPDKTEDYDKFFKRLVSGEEQVGQPFIAGRIELRPLEKGSRQRYGRLKFLQLYGPDEQTGTYDWFPLANTREQECVFEPGSGQAPVAPASRDWDIALDDLPASMILRKAGGGWALTIPGSDKTSYPCSADLTGEKVTIECQYRDDLGNGLAGPYQTYRFTGSMSGDGTAMEGTYTYTSSATKDPKDDPEEVVRQSGKWKATRRQALGP